MKRYGNAIHISLLKACQSDLWISFPLNLKKNYKRKHSSLITWEQFLGKAFTRAEEVELNSEELICFNYESGME